MGQGLCSSIVCHLAAQTVYKRLAAQPPDQIDQKRMQQTRRHQRRRSNQKLAFFFSFGGCRFDDTFDNGTDHRVLEPKILEPKRRGLAHLMERLMQCLLVTSL